MMRSQTVVFPDAVPPATPIMKGCLAEAHVGVTWVTQGPISHEGDE